ncbi:Protein of unknown function DUF538 [Dillenia turbinata]|uniref:Uncharacterized protein n=1 Tax=Dillenia turbinata TaxID=194707 RepID=A0AAN8VMW5_9MAGN
MAFLHSLSPTSKPLFLILSLLHFCLLTTSEDSIHDLLQSRGLPAGLFPQSVKSYNLDEEGHLQVFLDKPCLTKFENRVHFDCVIKANLTYGGLNGLQGLYQEELFLWLQVMDIIVDDPSSGLILFDIGLAHKQLSLSLFEDPPLCNPQSKGILEEKNGGRKNMGLLLLLLSLEMMEGDGR